MMRPRLTGSLLLLLLLGPIQAVSAPADVKSVTVTPAAPTTCDSVAITVTGEIPPCYEVVRVLVQRPRIVECMTPIGGTPLPCPSRLNVTVVIREPNPAATCMVGPQAYTRTAEVGNLRAGEWVVMAGEVVIPFASDVPDTTFTGLPGAWANITVSPDSTCPGPGCYIVSFHDPLLDRPAGNFCDATTTPGGRACVPLSLTNTGNVAGLQTTVETFRFNGAPTVPFLHVVAVEPVRRASGFQVGWTEDGSRTKILLYSNSGAVIPPGDGPVLRICYGVAPETIPDRYFVTDHETIVADPSGASIPPCQTPAVFAPGVLCVIAPGCDLNRDGVSDVLDIIKLVRCALASPGDACPDTIAARADCNGDGSVDIRDVVCCVRKIVGLNVGTGPGSGSDRAAATVAGEANQIAWDGPVRWLDAATGVARIKVDAIADWGGTQLSIDPSGTPVRVLAMRLLGAGPGVQLEWGVAARGIARAILFRTTSGPQSAWTGHVEVTLDRMSGPASGSLQLLNVRTGTAAGEPAAVAAYDPSLPVEGVPIAAPVLLRARPNPFVAQTEIAFVLPADARAELKVFDVHGRLVRSLVQGSQQAGTHRISWDGVDGRGKAARSGVYFAKLTVGTVTLTERILLLR